MRHSILNLAIAFCVCWQCAEAATSEPLEQIRAAAQDYVSAHLGSGTKTVAALLDERVHLPECSGPLTANASMPSNGNAWSVAVHCAAPAAWTLYVPVRASEYQNVEVLTRAMPPNMPIPADALTSQPRDVATMPYGYLSRPEDVINKQLRRPLAAGTALSPEALTAPTSVRRGQDVTLVSTSGGFSVRAGGKAMADGASGQRIKVENRESHRIVEGVVRDADTIEVGL